MRINRPRQHGPFVPFRHGWSFGSLVWLFLVAVAPVGQALWLGTPGEEKSVAAATRALRVYPKQVADGRAMVQRLEEWTRTNRDVGLLVDKSAYSLYLYHLGKRVREFPVELGREPALPKEQEGDGRTPEGWYLVKRYLPVGSTKFYRALLIDYPNQEDWRIFRQRQAKGELTGAPSPGGLIEVHGFGKGLRPTEGGMNWTLGCVALSNDDMDTLLAPQTGGRRVREGTPVAIIQAGSLPDYCYQYPEKW